MANVLANFSNIIIPLLIFYIVSYGVVSGSHVYDDFIKGAKSDENVSLIPDGTRVIGANTEDGVCTVNLSSEFINNANGGSAADTMCVYSIVNSLAELDNVQSVQFLIDGEKVEIFGSFIFDEPFEPNTELNKK